jgi:hypothetical protein
VVAIKRGKRVERPSPSRESHTQRQINALFPPSRPRIHLLDRIFRRFPRHAEGLSLRESPGNPGCAKSRAPNAVATVEDAIRAPRRQKTILNDAMRREQRRGRCAHTYSFDKDLHVGSLASVCEAFLSVRGNAKERDGSKEPIDQKKRTRLKKESVW